MWVLKAVDFAIKAFFKFMYHYAYLSVLQLATTLKEDTPVLLMLMQMVNDKKMLNQKLL